MFRVYVGPSSGGATVCIQQISVVLVSNQENSHRKGIVGTNFCIHTVVPPDDGPRYARNM